MQLAKDNCAGSDTDLMGSVCANVRACCFWHPM